MNTHVDARPAAATYTRPASREEILADAINCILAGRPLPEWLRAPVLAASRPATCAEGIARIMAGPGAR